MTRSPLIFFIAGEPSGDRIGAEIIKALRKERDNNLRVTGIGGSFMTKQGMESIFPMSDLTLMGAIEVIPKLPIVYKRYTQTLDAIRAVKPDLVVTIDSPDFCLRIAKKVKDYGFPVIHYTAPTVWAWRPGRAKKMAAYLDHLLLLYQFEKKYFDAVNLPNTFVGHPLCTVDREKVDTKEFRKKYSLGARTPLVCVLPGSRRSEVVNLLPIYHDALKRIKVAHPTTKFVLPVVPQVKDLIEGALENWHDLAITLVEGEDDKYAAMRTSKVALAASGTVTLELALSELPTVITYVMHPITVWLGRFFIQTKYIGLPNIILDHPLMPELIQQDCTSDRIVKELETLFQDPQARKAQLKGFKKLKQQLTLEEKNPSEKAAEVISSFLLKQGIR